MTDDFIVARATIDAPTGVIFDLLADPAAHVAIDGTGWLRKPVDRHRLTGTGQIFRMGMYHEGHPNKHYEMANRVDVFDRPHAIAWTPGAQARHIPDRQGPADGPVAYSGWRWRYDLEPVGDDRTEVILTYDWSRVPPANRGMSFPPFPAQHLDNSLRHLAELAADSK